MYKLEFTLKQHTPIIHFQHDQEGATLRASEVKPKLDQFIIENLTNKIGFEARIEFHRLLFNGTEEQRKWKNWLKGKGTDLKDSYHNSNERNIALIHLTFDYKIKIPSIFPERKLIEPKSKFPCFFGDMGEDYVKKKKGFSFTKELLNCEIFTYISGLKYFIALQLLNFFSITNFGTRQSKGFGSFYITPDSKYLSEYNIVYKQPNLRYSFNISINNNSTWNEFHNLFNVINLFYKSLRQGINEKGRSILNKTTDPHIFEIVRPSKFYFKPLIFLYAKEKLKNQWDKKTIKQYYLNNEINRKPNHTECTKLNLVLNGHIDKIREKGLLGQIEEHPNYETLTYSQITKDLYDFKDLFGLSSLEKWKSYDVEISKTNNEIDRFKSPIIFKPIQVANNIYTIYFDYFEIPEEYKGKEFNILNDGKGTLFLKIPTFFQWKDFFNFIFNKRNFDIDIYVDKSSKSYSKHEKWQEEETYELNYYDTLKSIYDQLQKKP